MQKIISRNKKFENLSGKRFGRLITIELDENRNNDELNRKLNDQIKQNKTYYVCLCDCGNITSISSSNLKSGHCTSCGCYHKEQTSKIAKSFKKYNTYKLTDEFGVCYLPNTNDEVLFDLEDYEIIKNILWKLDNSGYARGYDVITKKQVRMHKIITSTDETIIIDHINRCKLDNRKGNFRYATKSENRINSNTRSDNKSSLQGVRYEGGKWRSRIMFNKKCIHLGCFDDFEDAVKARLYAENKYYKEFAMQRNLFKKYEIE